MAYSTNQNQTKQEQIAKIAELIKDTKIAMLTTITSTNSLHSRPMTVQEVEFDGDLWFFHKSASRISEEIQQHQRVNVAFAKPEKQQYVSLSGHASVSKDRTKMKSLWSPLYKAWFPKGLEDPELELLKISVDGAEYWDSSSGMATQIFGLVQALVTGKEAQVGSNERVDLHTTSQQ